MQPKRWTVSLNRALIEAPAGADRRRHDQQSTRSSLYVFTSGRPIRGSHQRRSAARRRFVVRSAKRPNRLCSFDRRNRRRPPIDVNTNRRAVCLLDVPTCLARSPARPPTDVTRVCTPARPPTSPRLQRSADGKRYFWSCPLLDERRNDVRPVA